MHFTPFTSSCVQTMVVSVRCGLGHGVAAKPVAEAHRAEAYDALVSLQAMAENAGLGLFGNPAGAVRSVQWHGRGRSVQACRGAARGDRAAAHSLPAREHAEQQRAAEAQAAGEGEPRHEGDVRRLRLRGLQRRLRGCEEEGRPFHP